MLSFSFFLFFCPLIWSMALGFSSFLSLVFSPFWRRLVDFRRSLPLTLFTNDSLIQVLCFLLF
ncbi:unnamed protein product [Meloidogyne enterolobii]|uniref:Uncharacterized protein n=1 Tax=Meloidogyne enterolobii TaxID=390850 RepID=A0ACB0XLJ4_MELEN